jgi:hypothetical protein
MPRSLGKPGKLGPAWDWDSCDICDTATSGVLALVVDPWVSTLSLREKPGVFRVHSWSLARLRQAQALGCLDLHSAASH